MQIVHTSHYSQPSPHLQKKNEERKFIDFCLEVTWDRQFVIVQSFKGRQFLWRNSRNMTWRKCMQNFWHMQGTIMLVIVFGMSNL